MKNSKTSTFEVTWKKTRFSYSRQSDSLKFLYSNSFKWQFLRGISYVLYWNFVFSGMQWSLVFFLIHHLILTNDSSLFLNFYLSVIHLHEFISAMYSSELIQIRKIPELYFLIYELGISIYTAGKCSILQVTCFPLG